MFEVHVYGFKTREAAMQFARWYSNQGEQMIDAWWDARSDQGLDIGRKPMVTDILESSLSAQAIVMAVSN